MAKLTEGFLTATEVMADDDLLREAFREHAKKFVKLNKKWHCALGYKRHLGIKGEAAVAFLRLMESDDG